jgi:fucokinase
MDLLRASGDLSTASMVEEKVWASVASETSSAVKYGSKGTYCKEWQSPLFFLQE